MSGEPDNANYSGANPADHTQALRLPEVIYEDHHLIGVNKQHGDLVEWDKSGDQPLLIRVAQHIRAEGKSAGADAPFVGVIHRLDRPTSGCVVYAKTEPAQRQMNELFRRSETQKTYWTIVDAAPPANSGELEHYIYHDKTANKSYAYSEPRRKAKYARLAYHLLGRSDRYWFLEIDLLTGRHHQIRAQLGAVGCHVKGDLKYGARRSNPAGGIHLHAQRLSFIHPIREHPVTMTAEPPMEKLWSVFSETVQRKR